MSLINKFSVSYNLEQANKRRRHSSSTHTYIEPKNNRPDILSNEVAESLVKLGFDIETLMMLLKLHSYSTVEEALNLLAKDPDTGKYNHRFYQPTSQITTNCVICQGSINEHIDNDLLPKDLNGLPHIDEKKIMNTSSNPNYTNTSKLLTSTNNYDISQTPLISENNPQSLFPGHTNSNNIRNSAASSAVPKTPNPSVSNAFDFGKIEIPQETLDLFEDPDICRICFGEKVNPKNISQISCGHFFCDNCISFHMTTKIINGKVLDIKCLMGGCPKKYNDEEIRANVRPEIFIKYKKFKNEQTKLNNPNKKYVHCPYPNCEELVEIINPEEEFIICENNHQFCYKCHQLGIHKKGKCQKDDIILLQQIKKGNNKNAINYKQCPKCKVIIEKNEGCNQMHCINCNYNFCWLCMKKYTDDHYAIYNVRGCPGMRFETDSGIKWSKHPFLKVIWYLFSCFLGFLAVMLVLLFYLLFGCAYEFVNCYTKAKTNDDEDDEDEDGNRDELDIERQSHIRNNGIGSSNTISTNQKPPEKKSLAMICLVGFLGFCCQPLYLMFYILYGLMECYRRFNCWFYYVDY